MHNYFHIYQDGKQEHERTFVWPHHRNHGDARGCQACCAPQKPPALPPIATLPSPLAKTKPPQEKITFKFGKIRVDVKNATVATAHEDKETNTLTLRLHS